jgi:hypothetical protein
MCDQCKQDRSKSLIFSNLMKNASLSICATLIAQTKGVLLSQKINTMGVSLLCNVAESGEGTIAATFSLSSRLEYFPNGTVLNGARRRLLALTSLDNIISSFKVLQEQAQDRRSDLLNNPQLAGVKATVLTAQPTSSPTKRTPQPTPKPTIYPTLAGTRIDGCENSRVTYSCPPDTVINVTSSKFGRREKITACDVERSTCSTQADVTSFVHAACQQRQRCSVFVNSKVFGVQTDPCPGVRKVLQTSILCLDPDTGKPIESSSGSTKPAPTIGENIFTSVCTGNRLELACGKNAVITSVAASFGRQADKTRCVRSGTTAMTCNAVIDASNNFNSCLGQSSCSVSIKTSMFTGLSCANAYLLPGKYVCSGAQGK